MDYPKPFHFAGGIHPVYHKELTAKIPTRQLPLPEELIVSMAQHLGAPAKPCVEVGAHVVKGQVIGEASGAFSLPVHAPATGKVVAIEPRPLPNGRVASAVILKTESSDEQVISLPPLDWRSASKPELIERLAVCGLVGMGGAGFPVKIKLAPPPNKPIDTLIINGAECEPYLTSDHRLMLERPFELATGIDIARTLLGKPKVRICIEENKKDAISAVSQELSKLSGDIGIVILPTHYPQGSEKQQIYSVTKRTVLRGGLPMDVGCVVENVATICSIYDAFVLGRPLTHRIITVTGDAVTTPCNWYAPIGTPFSVLLDACDGAKSSLQKLVAGGPMMGFAVPDVHIAMTKTSSGLLALSQTPIYTDQPCIACGRCVDACPMRLSPAEMSQCIEADDIDEAVSLGVRDCFECGCCSWSCPAHRPLVHHFRRAKAVLAARASASRRPSNAK